MEQKNDFWTITITASVCAGDMSRDEVMQNAQSILEEMVDGSDIMNIMVEDATRD